MPTPNANYLNPSQPAYQAFSGVNMYVSLTIPGTMQPKVFGSLQALSCSITRVVAPIYGSGDANAKAFTRGKRAIAGTLTFTQFDRHALLRDLFAEYYGQQLGQLNVPGLGAPSPFNSSFSSFQGRAVSSNQSPGVLQVPTTNFSNLARDGGGGLNQNALAGIDVTAQQEATRIWEMVKSQRLQYVDQIPPFDITVSFANEFGSAAVAAIYSIILINEGFAWTIDDMMSESSFTYVARGVMPLTPLTNVSPWASANQ